jgi:hypoxia up-regulated 1
MATYDVQASYPAAATSTSGKPRTITTLVFPAGTRVGTKKTMTFKRRDDFTISLNYKDVVTPYVAFASSIYNGCSIFIFISL